MKVVVSNYFKDFTDDKLHKLSIREAKPVINGLRSAFQTFLKSEEFKDSALSKRFNDFFVDLNKIDYSKISVLGIASSEVAFIGIKNLFKKHFCKSDSSEMLDDMALDLSNNPELFKSHVKLYLNFYKIMTPGVAGERSKLLDKEFKEFFPPKEFNSLCVAALQEMKNVRPDYEPFIMSFDGLVKPFCKAISSIETSKKMNYQEKMDLLKFTLNNASSFIDSKYSYKGVDDIEAACLKTIYKLAISNGKTYEDIQGLLGPKFADSSVLVKFNSEVNAKVNKPMEHIFEKKLTPVAKSLLQSNQMLSEYLQFNTHEVFISSGMSNNKHETFLNSFEKFFKSIMDYQIPNNDFILSNITPNFNPKLNKNFNYRLILSSGDKDKFKLAQEVIGRLKEDFDTVLSLAFEVCNDTKVRNFIATPERFAEALAIRYIKFENDRVKYNTNKSVSEALSKAEFNERDDGVSFKM